jgi:uncharacterized membrane protein YjjP (DUF1212 family)
VASKDGEGPSFQGEMKMSENNFLAMRVKNKKYHIYKEYKKVITLFKTESHPVYYILLFVTFFCIQIVIRSKTHNLKKI